jgi:hypothetical protein
MNNQYVSIVVVRRVWWRKSSREINVAISVFKRPSFEEISIDIGNIVRVRAFY